MGSSRAVKAVTLDFLKIFTLSEHVIQILRFTPLQSNCKKIPIRKAENGSLRKVTLVRWTGLLSTGYRLTISCVSPNLCHSWSHSLPLITTTLLVSLFANVSPTQCHCTMGTMCTTVYNSVQHCTKVYITVHQHCTRVQKTVQHCRMLQNSVQHCTTL